MPCNEADTVRSARLEGKKMAIKNNIKKKKNIQVNVLKKSCRSHERK